MTNIQSTLYEAFDTQKPEVPLNFLVWLANEAELPSDLHILDMGCGPGRMLRAFSEQGWHVTAMESDTDYCAHAKQKAAALASVNVKQGGWGDLDMRGEFDLIVALNGPFAYLTTGEARADALGRSYQGLKPGGVLFLELPNLLSILYTYRPPRIQTRSLNEKRVRFSRHHEIDFDTSVFRTIDHFTITDTDGYCKEYDRIHDYAITSPAEMRYLLHKAAFEEVRFYNSFEARSAESLQEGGRMHISARKPHTV